MAVLIFFLIIVRYSSLAPFKFCKHYTGQCERRIITILQGCLATRKCTERKSAGRRQSLQLQHALALLSANNEKLHETQARRVLFVLLIKRNRVGTTWKTSLVCVHIDFKKCSIRGALGSLESAK